MPKIANNRLDFNFFFFWESFSFIPAIFYGRNESCWNSSRYLIPFVSGGIICLFINQLCEKNCLDKIRKNRSNIFSFTRKRYVDYKKRFHNTYPGVNNWVRLKQTSFSNNDVLHELSPTGTWNGVVIWPYNFQLDENDNNDDIQTSLNIH